MINVITQQMAQLREVEWAPDRKIARTGSWVLDTGVTEHWDQSLGVSRNDGITYGVGRVRGVN